MVPTNTLPYDVCPLNLEYVISKNKEITLTSNMMLVMFFIILFFISINCSRRETYLIKLLGKYKELVEDINKRHDIFDFKYQSIYNPSGLMEYLNSIEEKDSEAESKSDCESGDSSSVEPDQSNRRILRSHTKHQRPEQSEVLYNFDRDYNYSSFTNRKEKNHSNLGIQGKTWHLE